MESLIYSGHLIEQGQWWRLFTGHFVHLNAYHLLINLAGLACILMINRSFILGTQGVLTTCFLCLWVSAGLWLLNPDLAGYAGFSGVSHGLFIVAVTRQSLFPTGWKALLILTCVVKVVAEQIDLYSTSSLAMNIGGKVMVDAHFYGLVGGCVVSTFYLVKTPCPKKGGTGSSGK